MEKSVNIFEVNIKALSVNEQFVLGDILKNFIFHRFGILKLPSVTLWEALTSENT